MGAACSRNWRSTSPKRRRCGPTPLDQDGLLNLFSADVTGADYTLKPATQADMRGAEYVTKPSLEVVYDTV